MKYINATFIVPASSVDMIRTIARRLHRGDLTGLFTTALSPTGTEPATHYLSTGLFPFPFLVQLQSAGALRAAAQRAWAAGGRGAFPMSLAQVQAMINGFVIIPSTEEELPPDNRGVVRTRIVNQEPLEVTLNRMGLVVVGSVEGELP